MNKQELLDNLKCGNFSHKIVDAFRKVQRENFIPDELKAQAYKDTALPLEPGATISQPYTIAFMLSLLEVKKYQKILEIGSGCGYVLALISEITQGKIYGVELKSSLAEKSKSLLPKYKNINIFSKNGFHGLKDKSPFDRILISAEFPSLPEHLYNQLTNSGIIVVPVKNSIFQIKKIKIKIIIKEFPGFVFVPLITQQWT